MFMKETSLESIIIEPKNKAKSAVIWLHGLGSSGNDFAPMVPELKLEEYDIRFIFPHAPIAAVTINGGMEMPSWYDILEMSFNRKIDRDSLEASAVSIMELIQEQVSNGIPQERIFLAGFSQGGAVAYHVFF